MSILDHIFLYSILFAVFFTITRFQQQFINKHYWQIVAIPIILYSIILGCRYGWGNDYFTYKSRFEHPFGLKEENIGFGTINLFLNFLGFNYVGAYISYSLLYIITVLILLKDYKENKYMIALFLPATLLQSTFTIRQSVAHCFIFLALHFLNKKKWLLLLLTILVAYSIHPAGVLLIIPPIIFLFFNIKEIPWKISIPIYIVVSILTDSFNTQLTDLFSRYLPSLHLSNKFNDYLQNDRWYGENAVQEEWKQGRLTLFLSMFFHISIIYIGYISLKLYPKKSITNIYNTIVIGFILMRLFWNFEIFKRIVNPYSTLYFIPLGYALYVCFNRIKLLPHIMKWSCLISIVAILTYLSLYYGRFILQSPKYIFFWNLTY